MKCEIGFRETEKSKWVLGTKYGARARYPCAFKGLNKQINKRDFQIISFASTNPNNPPTY
jgi:hypothetical protein